MIPLNKFNFNNYETQRENRNKTDFQQPPDGKYILYQFGVPECK